VHVVEKPYPAGFRTIGGGFNHRIFGWKLTRFSNPPPSPNIDAVYVWGGRRESCYKAPIIYTRGINHHAYHLAPVKNRFISNLSQ
jgi:hypothetical protein